MMKHSTSSSGALGDNGVDVGGNTDDEQEEVDEVSTNLLGTVELGGGLVKEGGHDHGDGGNPHVLDCPGTCRRSP